MGRVVVHIQPDISKWRNTAADVPLRDGDILLIPKKANYVMVTGQVFNQTAISYRPGHSAKWYLSQAGGLTQIADKKAVFVIRADGSVIAAKNNSGWWAGDPLSASLEARGLDRRAGKDAKNRNPKLDHSFAGGADRHFCRADHRVHQAVMEEEPGLEGQGSR